ncbi:alpha/beta fold hydrolase [Nocardia sp. NPDC005745]|uniref:alpha/beta fold hydrolase n=1 Tax=Nocardia sp. NPDC005745 TaxID=3157061 RepID=UPI00340889BE
MPADERPLLAAADEGDGPGVVLLPGSAADRQIFLQSGIFGSLTNYARAVALDWRGAGESAPSKGDYGFAEEVEDVVALLDAKGLETACVVGVSHGAAVVLELALRHPDRVQGLVLCSPWPRTTQSMRQMFQIWQTVFSNNDPQAYGEAMAWWLFSHEFLDADPGRATGLATALFAAPDSAEREAHLATVGANLGFDVEDRLGEIRVPTLVLAGEQDRVVPAAYSKAVAEAIPGSRFELITGPSGSHAFLAEAAPQPTELIVEFIAEVVGAAAEC